MVDLLQCTPTFLHIIAPLPHPSRAKTVEKMQMPPRCFTGQTSFTYTKMLGQKIILEIHKISGVIIAILPLRVTSFPWVVWWATPKFEGRSINRKSVTSCIEVEKKFLLITSGHVLLGTGSEKPLVKEYNLILDLKQSLLCLPWTKIFSEAS